MHGDYEYLAVRWYADKKTQRLYTSGITIKYWGRLLEAWLALTVG